ncbi:hypothetical protein Pmar_PMAR004840 [Perkinsus marinus ATCC 50983]|uniref:RRM domain-containing protein n=1 Tax=Perkinsus marinus (strain ATCC 50983 / TXsc) TaxID=423536 RepID=C5LLB8_PERM5|nr:hypothetical protein Pmar_PMAR004840 [Perkinsus marinus ATCC 50983]EER02477.1 hypothetical protein Pmar_PMAR004840 [Perkinsus marinus ATCC 50983]|eukprot:XP_002769759.1 hypothetical protein Pmar_PMAR004840 [Perkinsus marinus ATCC 50983]
MNPPISTTEDDELFLKEFVAAAEQHEGGAVAAVGRHGDCSSDDDASLVTPETNNNMILGDILQTLQRSETLLRSVREENSELRMQLGILEQQLDRTRENLRDLTARKLLETTSTTVSPTTTTTGEADSTAIPVDTEQEIVDDAVRGTTNGDGNGGGYPSPVGARETDFIMASSANANNGTTSSPRSTDSTNPESNFTIPWSSVVKGVFTDTTPPTKNDHTATPTIPVDVFPTVGAESDKKRDSFDKGYGSVDNDHDGSGPWPLWRILDMLSCIPDEQVVCVKKIQLIKANVSTVLNKYFSSYGHVVTILLLQRKTRSHTSTLPPNMGFVVMSDPDAVRRILHDPEHNIQGNLCETTSFQNKRKVDTGVDTVLASTPTIDGSGILSGLVSYSFITFAGLILTTIEIILIAVVVLS